MKYLVLLLFLVSPTAFADQFKWSASVAHDGSSKKIDLPTGVAKLFQIEKIVCLVTATEPTSGEISKEVRFLSCGTEGGFIATVVGSCAKSANGFLGGEISKDLVMMLGNRKWLLNLSCGPK